MACILYGLHVHTSDHRPDRHFNNYLIGWEMSGSPPSIDTKSRKK
jgi:hypothetical protein